MNAQHSPGGGGRGMGMGMGMGPPSQQQQQPYPQMRPFPPGPGQGQGGPFRGPTGPPRPPNVNVLPGTAHLCYELDKKLLVWLRDGRTFLGCLKSVDQFGNLVLSETIERIYVGLEYGDIERGIFILRGENVILVGEWDGERERASGTVACEIGYILAKQAREEEQRQQQRKALKAALRQRGLAGLADESVLGEDGF